MDFFDHYQAIWQARWPALYEALQKADDEKFSRPNFFHQAHSELQQCYIMDYASTFPVQALQLQGHENVLDMCAAPGGKALIIAEKILPHGGKLTVNEYSRARFERLKKVFQEYLPQNFFAQIRFTHFDATRWGLFEPETYDAILLDAPCSGERHILHDPAELKKWTPARSKQLAKKQYTLLCAALMSLKPGGKLVYSTCSISPKENDEAIARLFKKKSEQCEIVAQQWNLGEKTEYGWQILPDTAQGLGPIYSCCFRKVASIL